MYKKYIETLIQNLERVQMYMENNSSCRDYEEAMEKLVGLFTDIKKSGKQVFFIGKDRKSVV